MPFTPPPTHTSRPTLRGNFGMSASTHWLATATGQAVLERGGNAFDAAVATAFTLHVVEPHLNGPGGDMTGIFVTAGKPASPTVLMGQGGAPTAATISHYRRLGLAEVPGAGALAAAVPTSVDAWLMLLSDHGTWELADVLEFAIHYAETGHPALGTVAGSIARVRDLFTDHWTSSAAQWMPSGEPPAAGDLIYNREYAQVLRNLIAAGETTTVTTPEGDESTHENASEVSESGENTTTESAGDGSAPATHRGGVISGRVARIEAARKEWREGQVAARIVEFTSQPHMHANGEKYAGVLTREDLATPQARYEQPVSITFRGYTLSKVGFWSQGPLLLQALKILDGLPDEQIDPSTELGAHTVIETLKLVLADRDAHYGDVEDSETTAVREWLLSDSYAAERRALITDQASAAYQPGTPPWRQAVAESRAGAGAGTGASADAHESTDAGPLVGLGSDAGGASDHLRHLSPLTQEQWEAVISSDAGLGTGEPTQQVTHPGEATQANGAHRGDTCHLDIVDRWGNMIAATPSGGWLQSNPTIPGLGFNLGTRLQMTWLEPGTPSSLQPGTRPRTTLSPTLISKDGQPIIALGTPGGDQQDQWQLLLVLRLLVGGYEPQGALDAPALHTTALISSFSPRVWETAGVVVEDRLGDEVISGLRQRGHSVTASGDWSLGRLSVVTRDPETGQLTAAANPRGAQGYAAGR